MSASSGLAPAGVRDREPPYLAAGVTVLFGARLTAWLIALIVVLVDVRPEPNLRHEPLLIVLSLLQIIAGLSYVPAVRPLIRRWSGAALTGRRDLLLLSAVDLTGAFALVYYSGGIGTPYYHVAVVALLIPTFLLGWRGSLAVLAVFLGALIATWEFAGFGRDVWATRGAWGGASPGLVLTPLLVVIVAQYLGWLARRIELGQRRTRALLEETTALYGVAQTFSREGDPAELTAEVVRIVGDTGRFTHVSAWERAGEGFRRVAISEAPHPPSDGAQLATLSGDGTEDASGFVYLLPDATEAGELRGLPISVRGSRWGILAFRCATDPARPEDVRLLRAVAGQLSLGLTKMVLLREQEELAAVAERGRIAREIHDGIAQSIYMLSLNLEKAAEMASADPVLGTRLRDLVGVAKEALMEVRHYIFDLKPLLSGDRTLVSTIRGQVKEFATVSELEVALDVTGAEPADLPIATASSLYRVVQEALANAYRHSGASHVRVQLTFGEQTLTVEVSDDGAGFSTAGEQAIESPGRGLRNMRERASELGARLDVTSSADAGTTVRLEMPLGASATVPPP